MISSDTTKKIHHTKNNNKKGRRKSRLEVIQVLYKYELLNENIEISDVFENYEFLDRSQIQKIDTIAKNYKTLKGFLISLLDYDWKWTRISPVIRAILLNGASEMFYIEPKIVINEAIEITKSFFVPEKIYNEKDQVINEHDLKQYRFVNAILQNYYKLLVSLENKSS
ncbi:transcription antitermination protein NusB [Mycoplasmopsis sturni]|uniref:transcription antitermination protein NusB n=1 Tax=Mycoplasmopsis sturni TaxID=39047 RepID=UPI00068D41D8|nr:transcription antitermination protein NusB [Mycoplasmopsis sturni]